MSSAVVGTRFRYSGAVICREIVTFVDEPVVASDQTLGIALLLGASSSANGSDRVTLRPS